MKNYILKSIVLSAVVLSSCSENEPKKQSETIETPLSSYLETVEAGSINEYSDNTIYSVGYQFKTKKAGTITALGVSAPQAGTYVVSLYDAVTNELLGRTEATLTEAQITAKPYGFQYGALTNTIQAEVDQLFIVVYDMNAGTEEIYRPEVESVPFQLDGSFIEFQGGFYGFPDEVPEGATGITFYTADIKFTYK